jgi:hypothetical protein
MGDCCAPTGSAQSWIDWQHAGPSDPRSLIVNASLASNAGTYLNSTNFNTGTFAPSIVAIQSGKSPSCTALESDNLGMVANAAQWNFQRITANTSATLAPPLLKVIFLRVGTQWQMTIPLSFGASTFTDVQLSFRDNAGTRGDSQATWPVIDFSGSFTGNVNLTLTVTTAGRFSMLLRCDTGAAVQMYETEWVITA